MNFRREVARSEPLFAMAVNLSAGVGWVVIFGKCVV